MDSIAGTFATLSEVEFETTGADLTQWTQEQINFFIDPSLDGQLLQFGFYSEAQDFNGSGIAYDNLSFSNAAVPEPGSASVLALLGLTLITRRRRKSA